MLLDLNLSAYSMVTRGWNSRQLVWWWVMHDTPDLSVPTSSLHSSDYVQPTKFNVWRIQHQTIIHSNFRQTSPSVVHPTELDSVWPALDLAALWAAMTVTVRKCTFSLYDSGFVLLWNHNMGAINQPSLSRKSY